MFLFENRQGRKYKKLEIKESFIQEHLLCCGWTTQQFVVCSSAVGIGNFRVGCQCSPCRKIQVFCYWFVNFLLEMCLGREETEPRWSRNQTLILFWCFVCASSWQWQPCAVPLAFLSVCGGCRELDQVPALLPASVVVLAEGRGWHWHRECCHWEARLLFWWGSGLA